VLVKSDGSIYFTDPGLGRIESELDFCGVYRVSPDLGSIHVLVWDFVMPNGLAFSPDEKILYVNDSVAAYSRLRRRTDGSWRWPPTMSRHSAG
jgi:gluconolactonase